MKKDFKKLERKAIRRIFNENSFIKLGQMKKINWIKLRLFGEIS